MKIINRLIKILILYVMLATQTHASTPLRFKIMTFNILNIHFSDVQYDSYYADWDERKSHLYQIINNASLDIIGF